MGFIREQIIKPLTRSKGWRKKSREHKKVFYFCCSCGREKGLETHHIKDFSTNPEAELDEKNFITLCDKSTRCHLSTGHLANWKSINPTVVYDSIAFLIKVSKRRGLKAEKRADLVSKVSFAIDYYKDIINPGEHDLT